ncbi:hypothetical protein ACE1ET_18350 [Saccharicrinis sp. FJH62]
MGIHYVHQPDIACQVAVREAFSLSNTHSAGQLKSEGQSELNPVRSAGCWLACRISL